MNRSHEQLNGVLLEKFWDSVLFTTDCWEWQGMKNTKNYGQFWINGRRPMAHRLSYELHKGKIPEGLQVDHLCRNPPCVNPDHLETVTHLENMKRGDIFQNHPFSKITHCPQGHEYSQENTRIYRGRRYCRTCNIIKSREFHKRWMLERIKK